MGRIVGVTDEGIFESGKLSEKHGYSINRVTLKMSDGTRKTRYTVWMDGESFCEGWFNLRKAREIVKTLRRDFEPFKPVSIAEMRNIAKEQGAQQAYNILLIGGYEFLDGTCDEYDELLKEFEKGCMK